MRWFASSPAGLGARLATIALALLLPCGGAAAGESKVNARYDVTLAGIEVGKAALVVDIDTTSYTAAASAKVSGIAKIIAEGRGSAGSRGTVAKDRLFPSSFALTASGDDKEVEVQFALDKAAAVKNLSVKPPVRPRPDRIELTDAHRRNVLDPMSAILFLVPGSGDMLGPQACDRVLPIFDGVTRYDLTFEFLRLETVKTETFAATAVVCRATFKAIAGFRRGRKDIEYMENNRDIAVWLVPAAGSRVLVPFRISVATKVGTCLIEAQSFTTRHVETRAGAPGPAPAGVAPAPARADVAR